MFAKLTQKLYAPATEVATLGFWEAEEVFEQSLAQRRDAPEFVFYDGPPFATGLPHYGHLLAGTIKDVVPRYQTMRGHYVDRVFGWDCHGLPVENEMEKELGINSKQEIEEYGVGRFNEACRSIVLRYTREWRQTVRRMGRWVDFDHGYRTMDRDYMESIWWVFRQLWDRGLIYRGEKIMWYCPRCATPLSNFEVQQGYEEVQDPALTVRFALTDQPGTHVLAWTTTPWTLPSNLALAVGADIDYALVADGDQRYYLAVDRLGAYYRQPPEILATVPGRELVGRRYEPLFPYFADLGEQGAFRIVAADFVSTGDGTGIVHMAPGFGEDDCAAAKANGLPSVCPVDAEMRFTSQVTDYAGTYVKDADPAILRRLKDEGKQVHRGSYVHNYPHCWRCEAPLFSRAYPTWFVRVEQLKERMLAANAQINWVPEHLKDGRFGLWLANARDWAISRNRYWGCPLPIWQDAEGTEFRCVGSVAELEALCGHPVEDIHKHLVDEIVLTGADGQELRRVPEVLDCWFESGSMPYAQHHYPFADKERVEANFPADFIAEGLDQTRGWFYTLVVLGAALFDKPAFRNVVVNGLVLAEDGSKMSKRKKNYPPPTAVLDSYGADALRLFLLSSPVVRGGNLCFSEDGVKEVLRTVIIPLCNAHSFLVTYAQVDGWEPAHAGPPPAPGNPLDQWVLSSLAEMVEDVTARLDAYDLYSAATRFNQFIDNLTNWYIRRSRRRFWKSENDADKEEAYQTLYYTLLTFCQCAAPFIPFVTEAVYRHLRRPEMPLSVHLCDYPQPGREYRQAELDRRMARAMSAVSLGRYLRSQAGQGVRQPLASAYLLSVEEEVRADLEAMADTIADELNVKRLEVRADEDALVTLSAKANFKQLGPRLGKQMKAAAKLIEGLDSERIHQLRTGQPVPLELPDGSHIELTIDDIELRRQEKEGLVAANDGPITVALDLTLTPELRREGWAREAVRVIQSLRKEADLEICDRIRVLYRFSDDELARLLEHADYIQRETLAVELLPAADGVDTATAVPLGSGTGWFRIAKVD